MAKGYTYKAQIEIDKASIANQIIDGYTDGMTAINKIINKNGTITYEINGETSQITELLKDLQRKGCEIGADIVINTKDKELQEEIKKIKASIVADVIPNGDNFINDLQKQVDKQGSVKVDIDADVDDFINNIQGQINSKTVKIRIDEKQNKTNFVKDSLLDKDFSTSNKKDATSQLRNVYKAFKPFYENNEIESSKEGQEAAFAYFKAYEEAIKKEVSEKTLDAYAKFNNKSNMDLYYSKYNDNHYGDELIPNLRESERYLEVYNEELNKTKEKYNNINLENKELLDYIHQIALNESRATLAQSIPEIYGKDDFYKDRITDANLYRTFLNDLIDKEKELDEKFPDRKQIPINTSFTEQLKNEEKGMQNVNSAASDASDAKSVFKKNNEEVGVSASASAKKLEEETKAFERVRDAAKEASDSKSDFVDSSNSTEANKSDISLPTTQIDKQNESLEDQRTLYDQIYERIEKIRILGAVGGSKDDINKNLSQESQNLEAFQMQMEAIKRLSPTGEMNPEIRDMVLNPDLSIKEVTNSLIQAAEDYTTCKNKLDQMFADANITGGKIYDDAYRFLKSSSHDSMEMISVVDDTREKLNALKDSINHTDESSISSGDNPAIESQNRLQQELQETQEEANKAEESLRAIYRAYNSEHGPMGKGIAWFSDDLETAATYYKNIVFSGGRKDTLGKLYLDKEKLSNFISVDAKGAHWGEIDYNGIKYTADELAELAKQAGYAGLEIKNVYDSLGGINSELKSSIYTIFDDEIVNHTIPASKELEEELKKIETLKKKVQEVLTITKWGSRTIFDEATLSFEEIVNAYKQGSITLEQALDGIDNTKNRILEYYKPLNDFRDKTKELFTSLKEQSKYADDMYKGYGNNDVYKSISQQFVDGVLNEKDALEQLEIEFRKILELPNETPVSSGINPGNSIDQEADKVVKTEEKKQKAKKQTKQATEEEIDAEKKYNLLKQQHFDSDEERKYNQNNAKNEAKAKYELLKQQHKDAEEERKYYNQIKKTEEQAAKVEAESKHNSRNKVKLNDTEKLNSLLVRQKSIYKDISEVEIQLAKLNLNPTENKNTIKATEDQLKNHKQLFVEITNEIKGLDDQFTSEQALKNVAEQRLETEKQINIIKSRNADSIGSNLLSKSNTMSNQLTTLLSKNWTGDFEARLKELQDRVTNFIEDLQEINPDNIKTLTEKYKELSVEMFNVNQIEKNLAENKLASDLQLDKLSQQIADFTQKNGAMGRYFKNQFKEIADGINAAYGKGSIEELKQFQSQILKLKSAVENANKTGETFGQGLVNRIKSISQSAIAMAFSMYDVIRYVRQAFGVIQQLDTALVDLRKTTTMTSSELEDFYFNATDLAKEMGVTTSEIINQAAAWSRLGYSSKEATETMAVLSSQFASISPGMSTEEAQEGLVSTMKAFGIEVENTERTVMDNINKIGNTMAVTNKDIIDMLERSSAAMHAANNSLEETIALESAAMEITQNAEMTGTAFKTISMRIRGKSLPPYTVMYMLCV